LAQKKGINVASICAQFIRIDSALFGHLLTQFYPLYSICQQPYSGLYQEEANMSSNVLETVLAGRRSQPQQLIEVLQDIQGACGYVSQEAMQTVSDGLGVPLIEVCRVAHFYKAFSLEPRGKHMITVCMGTACHVRGSDLILEEALGELDVHAGQTTSDGQFTVESVNCLGACALGPVVVMDDTYYDHMTPRKLKELIRSVQETEQEKTTDVQAQRHRRIGGSKRPA
jgi:NADH:ubiquinone oxidoreductase subunit E